MDTVDQALVLLASDCSHDSTGGKALRNVFNTAQREFPTAAFKTFEDAIFRRIFALVQSDDMASKRAGVAAMDLLIDEPSSQIEAKVIKFSNTLKHAITANSHGLLLVDIAKALGHLARTLAVPNNDFVDFEMNRGLEWLEADQQHGHRRLAACLVLRELAVAAPTLFFVKSSVFFDRIWVVLKDPRQPIRDAAADALAVALALLASRPSVHHMRFYFRTYEAVLTALEGNTDGIHGALRVVGAMLDHSGRFMLPRFDKVCTSVLQIAESWRAHKLIRLHVVKTLPRLAAFCPDAFARTYLRPTLAHLTRAARPASRGGVELRAAALVALGDLATSMGDHLVPLTAELMTLVRESLPDGGRMAYGAAFCPEVLGCASRLVEALKSHVSPAVPSLVGPMMRSGLSAGLIATLASISASLPQHKAIIQQALLEELTTVLSGKPFVAPGMVLGRRRSALAAPAPVSTRRARSASGADFRDLSKERTAAVVLSLRTLASFRFDGVCLLPFLRDCLVSFLDHPLPAVRVEAEVACAQLLVRSAPHAPHAALESGGGLVQGPSAVVVQGVLRRLLHVALADPDPTIRRVLLRELSGDARFFDWLKQPTHLATLFLFLSDESLDIRIASLRLLGNLAPLNAAQVLPTLRLALRRLIAELQVQSCDKSDAREAAATLLVEFLRAEPLHALVRPFMRTLVAALPLSSPKPRLSTVALEALGELCLVMQQEMVPFLPWLMPVLLDAMQDQSSTLKREASLRALGRLVSSTGYVVLPYLEYPRLLPQLLAVLVGSSGSSSLRKELLRTIGLLGALDP